MLRNRGYGRTPWCRATSPQSSSSRVAYTGLIVEIRANIYFPTVTNKPLCPVSQVIPKARQDRYLGTQESFREIRLLDAFEAPCISTRAPYPRTRQLFIYVSLYGCASAQKQIKMFSRTRCSTLSFFRGCCSAKVSHLSFRMGIIVSISDGTRTFMRLRTI